MTIPVASHLLGPYESSFRTFDATDYQPIGKLTYFFPINSILLLCLQPGLPISHPYLTISNPFSPTGVEQAEAYSFLIAGSLNSGEVGRNIKEL